MSHFLYDASKKLIIFNDISHLLFFLLGSSDMHLNMPYLYFCIIDEGLVVREERTPGCASEVSLDVLAPSKWRQTNRQCCRACSEQVEARMSDVKWRTKGGTPSGG